MRFIGIGEVDEGVLPFAYEGTDRTLIPTAKETMTANPETETFPCLESTPL